MLKWHLHCQIINADWITADISLIFDAVFHFISNTIIINKMLLCLFKTHCIFCVCQVIYKLYQSHIQYMISQLRLIFGKIDDYSILITC